MGDLQSAHLDLAGASAVPHAERSRVARSDSSSEPATGRVRFAVEIDEREQASLRDRGLSTRVRTLVALVRAGTRQLTWANRVISGEFAKWQELALAIPDARLRGHALVSLEEKRSNSLGAGFFCTLPRRRSATLVRLLVAYQVIWDYLDSISEDIAAAADAKGYWLHLALVEALTPGARISDYYKLHPGASDGGYLRGLVEACQEACSRLPSYPQVKPVAVDGVRRCTVQVINHEAEPRRREILLKHWAAAEFPNEHTLPWFEVTAAASAFLPYPLLALASEASCSEQDVALACAAYFPLMSLAVVLLDSYVDRIADLARGDHSYVGYYGDLQAAARRLMGLIGEMTTRLCRLPEGERHAVIAGCMVAMYLADDRAHSPELRSLTRMIARETDYVTRLVLPVLRMYRVFRAAVVPWRRAARTRSDVKSVRRSASSAGTA